MTTKPEPIVHVLTRQEITEVFEYIDSYSPEKPHPAIVRMANGYRFLYRLILTTGLRNSEAASLRVSDIDWNTGTAAIYDSKGRKDRIIYLSEDMAAIGKGSGKFGLVKRRPAGRAGCKN